MKNCIASPHWEACETCAHNGQNGCNLSYIGMTVYLGDWILCDDYAENEQANPAEQITTPADK